MAKPISVQLYSLRQDAAKDFVKVLKWVAEIGYKGVEPAGFWNLRPREFKKIVDDLGMKIYSSHSPWARGNNLGEAMEIADILGLKTIVCGYRPDDFKDYDAIKRTAEQVNEMESFFSRNGFTLFQHNHNFEFERIDGRLKYEIYAELCPKVKFQIDCFWSSSFGAEDPVEMLKLFADRTIFIHMKDGLLKQTQKKLEVTNGILDRKVELRALGAGELDIKSLVANIPARVPTITVELDYCNIDMYTAIEQSYKYMTENGFAEGNK
ncbi:MAG: TIM barrel protein [Victivallales bacterium]|nr:TIM barrel protein [Victivallales bacterium]